MTDELGDLIARDLGEARKENQKLRQQLATVTEQRDRAIGHVKKAAAIVELGDQRLTAQDGPCGNQPPDISLKEWKQLYQHLQSAIAEAQEASDG